MIATSPAEGHIITFYSYKGGTGRSMALANVAWILASQGKRVLVIDWDLEAPGIHRYFHPFLRDKSLASSEGLMEFLIEYVSHALAPSSSEPLAPDWYVKHADIVQYAQSLDWPQFKKPGTIDLIPAGRQVPSYAGTVNLFNWQQFYDKLGGEKFFDAAKQHMRADYDYILIDSRTGVSDTSGICTVQMPETVVICFTLNIQSIEGASAVAESIAAQREKLGIPVRILPVPTRVDSSEKEKVDLARVEAWRRFDPLLSHLSPEALSEYWGGIEVPYEPWYSFEEVLATFGDRTGLRTSMLHAMETLTRHVSAGAVDSLVPITEPERLQKLSEFLRSPLEEKAAAKRGAAERGEQAMARLSVELQQSTLDVILRLAHITASEATRRPVHRRLLGSIPDRVLSALRYGRLIVEKKLEDGTEILELSDDDVLTGWTRVKRAIEEDRAFLLWRQRLSEDVVAWERSRERSLLLRRTRLDDALRRLRERPKSFNAAERAFIAASERRRSALRSVAALAVLLLFTAVLIERFRRQTDQYQVSRALEDARVREVESSPASEEAVRAWIDALVKAGRVDEARQAADAAPTPAQKAVRFAVLGASQPAADAEADLDAASKAIAEIGGSGEQARAQVDVANVVAAQYPETATRLALDAVALVQVASADVVSRRTTAPASSRFRQTPTQDQTPAVPAEYVKAQLTLLRDLLETLQKVNLSNLSANVLRDADAVLAQVSPSDRAEWLLAVVDALPQPNKDNPEDLRREQSRKALQAIALLDDDAVRGARLLAAVRLLMRNGDPENAELILQELQKFPKPAGAEIHDVLVTTLRALARGGVERENDAIWLAASRLRPPLAWAQRYEALAEEAAAQAASSRDPGRARIEIEMVTKALEERSPRPADMATIEAALSHAYYRLEDGVNEKKARDLAVQIALREPDPKLQSAALLAIAMAAARCGDVAAAARLSQTVSDPAAVEPQLADLMLLMADVARGLGVEAASDAAKRIILIAPHRTKDQTLLAALRPFVAGAKVTAAIEIVNAISDPGIRYQAFRELSSFAQNIKTSDVKTIAASFEGRYLRSQAVLSAAMHERTYGTAADAHKLVVEAEEWARKVEDPTQRSAALADVAVQYALDDDLSAARHAAIACTVKSDRLRGFAALLRSWALAKQVAVRK